MPDIELDLRRGCVEQGLIRLLHISVGRRARESRQILRLTYYGSDVGNDASSCAA